MLMCFFFFHCTICLHLLCLEGMDQDVLKKVYMKNKQKQKFCLSYLISYVQCITAALFMVADRLALLLHGVSFV